MSTKIKSIWLLIGCICMCFLNSCDDEPEYANKIELNKTAITLCVGETETLQATFSPSDATDNTISWSSDNESVAVVDGGVITAVGVGKATITASCGSVTASCEVTVTRGGKYKYVFGYAYSKDILKFLTPTITLSIDGQEPIKYTLEDGNNASAEDEVKFYNMSIFVYPKSEMVWWIGERYETKQTGILSITYDRKDIEYEQFEIAWNSGLIDLLSEPFVDNIDSNGIFIGTHRWISITIGGKETLKETIDKMVSSSPQTVTF